MAAENWSLLWAAVSAVAAASSVGFALFIYARHVRITLFEKRFEVYEAVMKLLSSALMTDAPASDEDIVRYVRATRTAEFLFDKATLNRLDELYKSHGKFRSKHALHDKTPDGHPTKDRKLDDLQVAREELEAHWKPLKETFRRYLDLTSIKPEWCRREAST